MNEYAHKFFPALKRVPIVEERRGLPTMAPDAKHIVSKSNAINGLILATACSVGGVHHSPGIGRVVADIVTGAGEWPPAREMGSDRFAQPGLDDADLRRQCERIYAEMYRGAI